MKSLLIVAHGSRRAQSNREVLALAKHITDQTDHAFGYVAAAFLEIASPSIPQGLENCVGAGATEVVIFPYFLAAGRHVVDDIPAEVAGIAEKYPDIRFTVAAHLGMSRQIPQLIVESTHAHPKPVKKSTLGAD